MPAKSNHSPLPYARRATLAARSRSYSIGIFLAQHVDRDRRAASSTVCTARKSLRSAFDSSSCSYGLLSKACEGDSMPEPEITRSTKHNEACRMLSSRSDMGSRGYVLCVEFRKVGGPMSWHSQEVKRYGSKP